MRMGGATKAKSISDNVSAVNEPARADPQGGEAGSRPFPSYTFHGLPGQRAKRASVNPACYLNLGYSSCDRGDGYKRVPDLKECNWREERIPRIDTPLPP